MGGSRKASQSFAFCRIDGFRHTAPGSSAGPTWRHSSCGRCSYACPCSTRISFRIVRLRTTSCQTPGVIEGGSSSSLYCFLQVHAEQHRVGFGTRCGVAGVGGWLEERTLRITPREDSCTNRLRDRRALIREQTDRGEHGRSRGDITCTLLLVSAVDEPFWTQREKIYNYHRAWRTTQSRPATCRVCASTVG